MVEFSRQAVRHHETELWAGRVVENMLYGRNLQGELQMALRAWYQGPLKRQLDISEGAAEIAAAKRAKTTR